MGLLSRIASYPIVGLDTSIFIYHLEADPTRSPLTGPIFTRIANGEMRAVTSVITLLEINVRPLQLKREDVARKYEAVLVNYPNLTILDVTRDITRQAARIRAEFGLRTPDAIQVAASLKHGAGIFITNDRQISRLASIIDILILDDLIENQR
jgi:predicted nucleic acid-binding protein